ncbi:MAG: hypothetical protein D6814_10865 [Calditrichaeota bacterium]|nr:MAG: hypothetical protein D6814_10865 [Calditrichota bacterium]
MSNSLRAEQKQKFEKLLMKAIDHELDEQEKAEFNFFIEHYPQCKKEWEAYKKLREVTQAMKFKNPSGEVWDAYWLNVYNRLERKIAWILFSIGAIILLTYGGFKAVESLIADPNLAGILKVAILLLIGGLAILLVSVIREKWFIRKKDPYKEVQR